jgi:hypothetical protein
MKLKVHFGKAARFVVPKRKIIQGRIYASPLNWPDICNLAMAEQIKSCRLGE